MPCVFMPFTKVMKRDRDTYFVYLEKFYVHGIQKKDVLVISKQLFAGLNCIEKHNYI